MRSGDVEMADRLARRRARLMPVLAVIFLAWQVNYLSMPDAPLRTVDQVKIGAWVLWVLALLLLLTTGGGLFRRRAVRDLLNDEGTRAHRMTGLAWGFSAAIATGLVLYIVGQFEPVSGRDAIHLILSVSIAAALVAFGVLERRALRGA